MAYPQYQQLSPYTYQPQVPAPMDRLAQLQAQQYQMPNNGMPLQAPQQPPQTNQGLLWVQGEEAVFILKQQTQPVCQV